MHLLLDPIDRHASDRPAQPAAWDQSLALTFAQFRGLSCGLAGQIAAQTDRPRVGVLVPTSAAAAVSIYACWYAGRAVVPLNFLLAPAELTRIVQDAGLDLVLTIDRFAPLVETAGARALVLAGNQTLVPADLPTPRADERDIAAVIYTSGTAGEPKGVCLSVANLARNVAASIAAVHMTPDDVFIGLIPQFHAYGFTTTTLVPLSLGAAVYYLPRFSPLTAAEICRERRVSVLITIASMFGALLSTKSLARADVPALRLAVSGGEPLPLPVARGFEQRFGVRLLEGYGMTEASPVVSLNTHEAYRLGSVGRPLDGISVTACDAAGRAVAPGEEGELTIRGHGVMQGYLNKPEQTSRAIRDGALFTGDVGHVDADGFVFITGRAKEMMIVGGENVYPSEIERVLLQHPSISEAAVIGTRDDIRGELPVAFVTLMPDAPPCDENALRAFCREHLAGYKVPRRVYIGGDLPRGPTGKILKRALRAPAPDG
ncbi:MAG: AMP-binding protein [Phycisphaerales bacterium]|nr:AMP-binding protein [Phycisphaerales bacterium]